MSKEETLYARWLSGDLSASELEELKASGELAELEAVTKAMDQSALPAYDLEAAYSKFKAKHPSRVAKRRKLNPSWIVGIAASIAVLITASLFVLNRDSKLVAANGAMGELSFVDGSEVLLNDGSSIQYKERAWDKERLVQLEGEAVFTVTKGSPFIVETDNGNIEVLGTQFNVRAWGDKLYVECYEGRVRVESNGQEVVLAAAESVNVVKGKMETIKSIKHQETLWYKGMSRFQEEDLNEAIAELGRQFDLQINAPDFGDRPFSGFFRHDNIQAAIKNVCKPEGLNCILSADEKRLDVSIK